MPDGRPRLLGKVAIVTGSGSAGAGVGIGRAIAMMFARAGAKVGLVDHRIDNAAETERLIAAEGSHDTMVLQCDVTRSEQCRTTVAAVSERWGRLDILINNVGIAGSPGTAVDVDEDRWDKEMRVNLLSMVLMAKFAIPEMVRAGGGSIVNVSSIMGLRGGTKSLLYGTSKGAVVNMTRTMAFQHGPSGIRVNCIAPGHVLTPMVFAEGLTEDLREARRRRSLLKTEGTAWDIAHAALYLASDEARWVTGITLPVDGGFLAAEPRS